ncbi:MAG: response regulator [Bacteroidales bacterium]|nr:response regulator [Bacteroidales bacterium]
MNIFQNLSIKNKIISIILFVSTLTIVIGFVIVGIRDVKRLKQEMLLNNLMNTKLIGEYTIAPLTFGDNAGAENILSKLSTIPEIVSGALYDHNGVLFASYKKNDEVFIPPLFENPDVLVKTISQFADRSLNIDNPIVYENVRYGIISIQVDTSMLIKKTGENILILAIILLGMIIFSFILANRFQKIISEPILELARLTRKISDAGDYDVHIERKTNDEIGVLYEDFNNMLNQILNREAARDLAEKNLLKAKEKAEESDQLKSAFLANMSHEIRTPMNAILGFAELISMSDSEVSSTEKENYVKLINVSGNNLLRLIDDIIDISKIEAGQIKIYKKKCYLNETLKDIQQSFIELRKINEKENIEIRLNELAQSQNLIIKTDIIRLNQIFTNLIGNALKFTEEGFIEFGYEIVNNEKLLFYIKDTGVGMDQNKKDLVFDRFTKIEDDNSRLYRGAGLGLAISKSLVELLGGNIWVDSALSAGSTFYFNIPFDELKESNRKQKAISISENYDWQNKTILVVEDEPANIIYIEEVLKATKAKVLRASNGKEAVDIYIKNSNNIDIIIMDIKMPVMNGFEATRQIKNLNKNIPIISQSAYAMQGDIDKGLNAGMTDYLIKPIKPKMLLSILNKHLNNLAPND